MPDESNGKNFKHGAERDGDFAETNPSWLLTNGVQPVHRAYLGRSRCNMIWDM